MDKTYYVMLPPELCLVHPLPGPLVRGAQRLPSVMRRVESMLLAIQLKHQINFPIAASKVWGLLLTNIEDLFFGLYAFEKLAQFQRTGMSSKEIKCCSATSDIILVDRV